MIYRMLYDLRVDALIVVTSAQVCRVQMPPIPYTARIIRQECFETLVQIGDFRYFIEQDNLVGVIAESGKYGVLL